MSTYNFHSDPPTPPPLPSRLLQVWPVIITGIVGFFCATIASICIPALHNWRPIAIAGLVVGFYGMALFLWQRAAARRGKRTAQAGLNSLLD